MINLAEIQTKVEKTIIYSQNYPFELNCSNLIQNGIKINLILLKCSEEKQVLLQQIKFLLN